MNILKEKYWKLLIALLIAVVISFAIPKLFLWRTINKHNKEFRANFPVKVELPDKSPSPDSVLVFIMAGQSNMAGRARVEPKDTISNKRILTINDQGELILAKEPLHNFEPSKAGLDCGVSFGTSILNKILENYYVLILPTAVGKSNIEQWINDSICGGIKLLSNYKEKIEIGKRYGAIKGVLWHQGENDALNDGNILMYEKRLSILFTKFRQIAQNDTLPIIIGELGSFSKENEKWQHINLAIHEYSKKDIYSRYVFTQDLNHGGDRVHFDAEGQREMGRRFADKYLDIIMAETNF